MCIRDSAITIQSSVIISLCLYTLATSIIDITKGGSSVELGITLPYLITSIIICFLFWNYFHKQAKLLGSEYVRIESTEWQMDAFLSLGVLVGMSMVYFLRDTHWHSIIPYIDSGMVIIISLLFLRIPIKTFSKNLRELLQFAPDDNVSEMIHEHSHQIAQKYQYIDTIVRVAKMGNSYTVEIDFLLPKSQAHIPLQELDLIRQELYELIRGDYEMWLTISFTTERKWIF
jgi:predicted Co/Zn/Cd cation transporter (cation efflux family)